ncbi:AbrB family transcriptional regulator [Sphingomonas crocodyli]|uniref:AbrB family transcriptional regulator n=1 Tax=Sphingomonas crocodyli TaxID=1979270 RepID=UPI0013E3C53E|nr:AbrB family transcriptional regulator [Sphingomonas crocodyli]
MGHYGRIAALLVVSALFAALLDVIGLPAALLLGPMIAAIVFASRGWEWELPKAPYQIAQAVIGLLVAKSLDPAIVATAWRAPWLFLSTALVTVAIGLCLGWLLARRGILPGKTAIWGSMPGAAAAMTLMAREDGADWQLVATMMWLRVIMVAVLGSSLAALLGAQHGSHLAGQDWFPPIDMRHLAETVVIGVAGLAIGRVTRLPAPAFTGPLLVAMVAVYFGLARPQLPGWLLAASYLSVGWQIGLGFTPEITRKVARLAPRLLVSLGGMILACALYSLVLARLSGQDLMTAYLATSPGGIDAVAIIATSVHVDVPFVLAMQLVRFIAVIIIGPLLARAVATRMTVAAP